MCPLERAFCSDANSGQNHKTIIHAAREVNRLAKLLTGQVREAAYSIKALLVSALILDNVAVVNGRSERGIVALDILTDPPSQIHIKLSSLTSEAQAVIADQLPNVRAVTPLRQRLDPGLVGGLSRAFPARRSCAA